MKDDSQNLNQVSLVYKGRNCEGVLSEEHGYWKNEDPLYPEDIGIVELLVEMEGSIVLHPSRLVILPIQ